MPCWHYPLTVYSLTCDEGLLAKITKTIYLVVKQVQYSPAEQISCYLVLITLLLEKSCSVCSSTPAQLLATCSWDVCIFRQRGSIWVSCKHSFPSSAQDIPWMNHKIAQHLVHSFPLPLPTICSHLSFNPETHVHDRHFKSYYRSFWTSLS